MESAPKFLFFDLGNVVVSFDHGIACRRIGRLIGQAPEVVHAAIFASNLQRDYELGEVTERAFHEQFCRLTNSQPGMDELLCAGREIFQLNQPVMSIVKQIYTAGHRLGILSDTCRSHWQYLCTAEFPGIDTFFEIAVLSFEVGLAKPDPMIFRIATERAGVRPEQIFFVDDRIENVAGATSQGWDALLFRGAKDLAAQLRRRQIDVG